MFFKFNLTIITALTVHQKLRNSFTFDITSIFDVMESKINN